MAEQKRPDHVYVYRPPRRFTLAGYALIVIAVASLTFVALAGVVCLLK